jgi:ABC-2 type transport system permease protein
MTPMPRLLRAEAIRLRSTRTTAAIALAVVLAAAGFVALAVGLGDVADLRGADGARTVLSIGGAAAYPGAYVLGALGMAEEHRHGTLVRALLVAPAYWPVVVAKGIAYAAAGAALGVLGFLAAFVVAAPWLASRDAGLDLASGVPWLVGLGAVVAAALFGVAGVGVAALVRSRAVAVAAGLVWIFVVDAVVVVATSDVGRFLPGGAALSLVRAGGDDDVLPMAAGAGLLVAYAGVLLALGAAVLVRRRSAA